MKYKLNDFEGMTFLVRRYKHAGNPKPIIKLYKGVLSLAFGSTVLQDIKLKTDAEGYCQIATANYPNACIQVVFNPINKNVKSYRMKAINNFKLTSSELLDTFMKESNISKLQASDMLLDYEVTFRNGFMLALELSKPSG